MKITEKVLRFMEVKNEFLFVGEPGCGKTYAAEEIAKEIKAEVIFQQVTSGTRIDSLREEAVPSEETVSGIEIMPGALTRALISSKEQKTVLILDEWDKTPSSMDAVLLDFLQNCRIIYKQQEVVGNKKNLVVILTANCGRELTEPLMRRVVKVAFPPMEAEFVEKVLKTKFNNKELVALLVKLYKVGLEKDLRKKATLQELQELGNIIELLGGLDTIDLEEILDLTWKFVFKYDEDMREVEENVIESLGNRAGARKIYGSLQSLSFKSNINISFEVETKEVAEKLLETLQKAYGIHEIKLDNKIVGLVEKKPYMRCLFYIVSDGTNYGVVGYIERINIGEIYTIIEKVDGWVLTSFVDIPNEQCSKVPIKEYANKGIKELKDGLIFESVPKYRFRNYLSYLEVKNDWWCL